MLDHVLRALVIVPFYGVPLALVAWIIYQCTLGRLARALIGLVVGAPLCLFAFLFFLSKTYCESCSGRPVSPEETVAIIAYFAFGLAMLLVLGWTAHASRRKPDPDQGGDNRGGRQEA